MQVRNGPDAEPPMDFTGASPDLGSRFGIVSQRVHLPFATGPDRSGTQRLPALRGTDSTLPQHPTPHFCFAKGQIALLRHADQHAIPCG